MANVRQLSAFSKNLHQFPVFDFTAVSAALKDWYVLKCELASLLMSSYTVLFAVVYSYFLKHYSGV